MAKKMKTEEQLEIERMESLVKRASDYLDREIEALETGLIDKTILAAAMDQWITAKRKLEEYKYKFEREKYFLQPGQLLSQTEEGRTYIDVFEKDEVVG